MNADEIIELMEELVDNSSAVPFSNKKLIDCEQMRDYIDNLQMQMPNEIKKSKEILENKDKIIADANKEAEDIRKKSDKAVEAAKEKAIEIMSETEIVRLAKEHAAQIIAQAQEQAQGIIADANAKDAEVRRALADNVNKTLSDTKAILEKNLSDVVSTINAFESLNAPKEAPAEAESKV
ncbi:MAG: hypothetical protein ACI4JW_12000 [Oscillospiraceae bacterium]